MVLSGEGTDTVCDEYLYFQKAPNEQEFYNKTVGMISWLHMYDCLFTNKAMSAWGWNLDNTYLFRMFAGGDECGPEGENDCKGIGCE